MKVAVVGSRKLTVPDLGQYLSEGTTEIISGGAAGIDSCARDYALSHDLKLTEFLPDYKKYGRSAPLVRNRLIVQTADRVLAIWDLRSRGTKHTIDYARRLGKPVEVITIMPDA
jgi:predicted Rossmann fold nucleotide-binding protein DprA/Smf involved in DNA uptake